MPRKPPVGKSLAEVNPALAKEWHPNKNGDLTPFDFSQGAKIKVWWQCSKAKLHEWQARIDSRNLGSRCPKCPRKPPPGESLAEVNPELAKEWHPNKNYGLTAYDFTSGSSKKVWWKCPKGEDHEWKCAIDKRACRKFGCPICNNRKVVASNCLSTMNPGLAKEWHSTKNGDLKPTDVTPNYSKKVWWQCLKGEDHEWMASPYQRIKKNTGCGVCAKRVVVRSNSLGFNYPEIAKEWHPTKNRELTPFLVPSGGKTKVWWKCPKGDDHEWIASIEDRIKGSGCHICWGRKIGKSNSLVENYPDLVKEWHPIKNQNIKIESIKIGVKDKVWWKCPNGDDHEWRAAVNKRVKGNSCPYCQNLKVTASNSLFVTDKKLAEQWHPTKNKSLTPHDITSGSNKTVWWKCPNGEDHEWKARLNSRQISGCPFCTLTPQSRQELTITFELLTIFKGIDPKGFKKRIDGTLYSIDIYIPKINIGIEFDGSYWHKDKAQLDKVKTEKIEQTGLNLIRVRQKPLERLFEDDVMAEEKFDGKQITNDILKQIVKDNGKYSYTLDKRTLNKIDNYLLRDGLQNEKGLDKYIDQILTEKAERKK